MDEPLVIVPLRAGKTRLSPALDDRARADLRAAMLEDVLAAIRGAGSTRVVVAAGDDESAELAASMGVDVHRDGPDVRGLDEAVRDVVDARPSTGGVLVVMADLPGLRVEDVRALLTAPGQVVLAPAADGGTGALLRRPAGRLATAYGPDSAVIHAARALDSGVLPTILDLAGCRVDVDTSTDLDALVDSGGLGPATSNWLRAARAA